MLQDFKASLVSRTWRVSGECGLSPSRHQQRHPLLPNFASHYCKTSDSSQYLDFLNCFLEIFFTRLYGIKYSYLICLVGWVWRIHRIYLSRGERPFLTSVLDMTLKNSMVPVMLKLWGLLSTPSLPLLPAPLWPGVVAPDIVQSMSQIKLNCVLMLNWIAWNRSIFYIETANLC